MVFDFYKKMWYNLSVLKKGDYILSNYNFVKLKETDAVAIQKVMSQAFKIAYFSEREEQEEQQYIKNLINSDNTKFYGVTDNNQLVAAAYYIPLDNDIYELSRIMVIPSYQKKKIGSFLLSETIEKLRTVNKVRILFLECQKNVMKFYQSNGFQEVTPDNRFYTEPSFMKKQNSLNMYINEDNFSANNTRIMGKAIYYKEVKYE